MILSVVFSILAVLIALSFLRLPMLLWAVIWPLTVWVFIRFGITPHVPSSVLGIYISLTLVGVVAYIIAEETRSNEVANFFIDKKFTPLLIIVGITIPALVSWKVYADINAPMKAPTYGRTIHPAPPGEITFKGKSIDLIKAKNPYRPLEKSDPQKFREHVSAGKKVYYENCVFCHGDDLMGDGIFAHGFDPVPAVFNSETTIPMLQESYLFWRIAKGGPGLPEESGPWNSSMPAWEQFLSEDEIWDVILFLYDYIGKPPRSEEEHHE